MDDIAIITPQEAWKRLDRLRHMHGLTSTLTPAGILLEHPTAGALHLPLWDSKQDLVYLLTWLRNSGLITDR